MPLQSAFIVSLPRSGSTVLTNLLDRHDDVVCPPESFFPAVLNLLCDFEMTDTRHTAALFVVSCSDGCPLTLDEAEKCIRPGKKETLDALALAIAAKSGRNVEGIRTVVWKFTRMVGQWKFAGSIGGRFIILHRNPLNVYESQFRVPFGVKNRNPLRFALFATSYEVAFSSYPRDRLLSLEYADIPSRLEEIARWIGSSGGQRETTTGTLAGTSGKQPWHSEIHKPFENRDSEKIRNLTPFQTLGFNLGRSIFRCLPPVTRMARRLADARQMTSLRRQAAELLQHSA